MLRTTIVLFTWACGGGGGDPIGPPAPVPVATVSVALDKAALFVGQSTTAAAELRDATGALLAGRTVTWSSSNASVATVTPSGQVTAIAPGTTSIAATGEGRSGAASLTVTVPPVATIALSLGATSIAVGETTVATTETRDAAGAVVSGRTVAFVSSNASVATVSANGLVTAIGVGAADISATSESRTATVSLVVRPEGVATVVVRLAAATMTVGQTTAAMVEMRNARGEVLSARAVAWTSSNTDVATVSANGTVAAVAPGVSTITASSEGKMGSAQVTILRAPVATVSMSADSVDVPIRTTRVLVATPRDAAGRPLANRDVQWQSSAPATAAVSSTGIVTMLEPGIVTITATSEGRVGTTRVRGSVAVLSAIIDSIRKARGVPAMGGAILSREGLIAIGVAGSRRAVGGLPVTTADKWHIGSNGKAITGMLAGIAVDAGVLSWDRTVAQAFPDYQSTMRPEYQPVTLRNLLSHTGGLQNNADGVTDTFDAVAGRREWLRAVFSKPPYGPRGVYFYSNPGYAAAGAMIERAWASPFESLMSTRLLQPLGVSGAGFGPTTGAGGMDQPVGHFWNGSTWTPCEACDAPPSYGPAGTMHMPLAGWARITQELMLADQGRSALLSQATARMLTTNAVPAGGGEPYAIGWQLYGTPGARILAHDGTNTFNHSRAVVYLDSNVAILVVVNASDIVGGTLSSSALDALWERLSDYWRTGR